MTAIKASCLKEAESKGAYCRQAFIGDHDQKALCLIRGISSDVNSEIVCRTNQQFIAAAENQRIGMGWLDPEGIRSHRHPGCALCTLAF